MRKSVLAFAAVTVILVLAVPQAQAGIAGTGDPQPNHSWAQAFTAWTTTGSWNRFEVYIVGNTFEGLPYTPQNPSGYSLSGWSGTFSSTMLSAVGPLIASGASNLLYFTLTFNGATTLPFDLYFFQYNGSTLLTQESTLAHWNGSCWSFSQLPVNFTAGQVPGQTAALPEPGTLLLLFTGLLVLLPGRRRWARR